ncbi:MAG: transglutaminase family protein [Telmatospirillum sp.]|nr:transglutaminase family protein [Telmatospirillum sp.]
MRVAITQEAIYRYPAESNYSIQYLRLCPMTGPDQRVLSWRVAGPGSLRPWTDGFGNAAHVLVVEGPHNEVRVRAVGEVDIADAGRPLPADTDPHPPELFLRPTRLTEADDHILRFAGGFRPFLAANVRKGLDSLMTGIHDSVDGAAPPEPETVTASQALRGRTGGSWTRAHLFLSCCRSLGVPARFVSGFVCREPRDRGGLSPHAWAEAWGSGAGWLRFDSSTPMSNTRAHVRVAVGLDYFDTAPIRGLRRGSGGGTIDMRMRLSDGTGGKAAHQAQQ